MAASGRSPALRLGDQTVRLPLGELGLGDLGGGEQLGPSEPRGSRRLRVLLPGPLQEVPPAPGGREFDPLPPGEGVEVLADDLQRKVVVPLHPQDAGEPLHVLRAELPVAGGRPPGLDEPLGLQEPDLGDGHFGKLVAQLVQHRADADQPVARGGGAGSGTARRCSQHGPSLKGIPEASHAPLARIEDQPVLADLHLVTVGQNDRVDRLAVDVRAVEAADVGDGETAVLRPPELDVPPGDRDVVQEDVALRVTAGRRQLPVEEEPAAGVRPRRATRSADPSGSASTAASASGESDGSAVWPVTSAS